MTNEQITSNFKTAKEATSNLSKGAAATIGEFKDGLEKDVHHTFYWSERVFSAVAAQAVASQVAFALEYFRTMTDEKLLNEDGKDRWDCFVIWLRGQAINKAVYSNNSTLQTANLLDAKTVKMWATIAERPTGILGWPL